MVYRVFVGTLALALSACASLPPVQSEIDTRFDFPSFEPDSVFTAVMLVLGEAGHPIGDVQADFRIVETEWMRATVEGQVDCGPGGGFYVYSDPLVRYSVFVRDTDPGSAVTVNAGFQRTRSDGRVQDCASTGVLEWRTYELLSSELGVPPDRVRYPEPVPPTPPAPVRAIRRPGPGSPSGRP